MTDFDGETYERERDHDRLQGQLRRVEDFLSDGNWHTLSEIALALGDPESSISARIRDLRKPKFGAYLVQRRYQHDGLWEYQMTTRDPKPAPVERVSLDPRDYVVGVDLAAGPDMTVVSPKRPDAPPRPGPRWQCTNCAETSPFVPPIVTLDPAYRRGRCPSCGKNTQHRRVT